MKGERCTIERPLFISSANFQLMNICSHRIKKVRINLHTLTSQQKIHWYRVEYITLFCNGFTDARSTPKPEAPGSNPGGDAILRKCEGHFSMWKTIFAFFILNQSPKSPFSMLSATSPHKKTFWTNKKSTEGFLWETPSALFCFYIAIQPRAFATELTRMIAAKMGHR